MAKNNDLGSWGEDKAAKLMAEKGFSVIERNYRCRYGEIDLIAEDEHFLVFAEVRLRKTTFHGRPEETVDSRKQDKLRKAALMYLSEHPTEKQPRFDVIALYASGGTETFPLPVRYIENAFS